MADGGALTVKGQDVIAARRAIAENENLAPTFVTQGDQVVACAAQETGEVEVASLKCRRLTGFVPCNLFN